MFEAGQNGLEQGRKEPRPRGVHCRYVEGSGRLRTPMEDIFSSLYAEVAELADALDSGSSARKGVRVQIPASAPFHHPGKPRVLYRPLHPSCELPSDPLVHRNSFWMTSRHSSTKMSISARLVSVAARRLDNNGLSLYCGTDGLGSQDGWPC